MTAAILLHYRRKQIGLKMSVSWNQLTIIAFKHHWATLLSITKHLPLLKLTPIYKSAWLVTVCKGSTGKIGGVKKTPEIFPFSLKVLAPLLVVV